MRGRAYPSRDRGLDGPAALGPPKLEASFAAQETPPREGYVLDFEGGPWSAGPRQVLEECYLLERGAAGGPWYE